MFDVLGYLLQKGINPKRADSRNIHTACFFCDELPEHRGRLYINIDPAADIPGLWFCHRCGRKGSLTTIKRHFGDDVPAEEADTAVRSEILNIAAAFYQGELKRYRDVLSYLTGPKRGLTMDTITGYQLGYAPMEVAYDLATEQMRIERPRRLYSHLRDDNYEPKDIFATGLCFEQGGKIVDSLAGMITIPYRVAGNVVAVRGRTWPFDAGDFAAWSGEPYEPAKGKYKTIGGTNSRLFNTDACWETEEIAICEGELDALVLQQHGFRALGVPGANAWQDHWDDYIYPMRRVWLVFDRDAEGERGAQKLVERFGSTKVRRIHLSPEGVKCDPTQWFCDGHTSEEFEELLSDARKGGLLVTVREAIAEFEEIQSQPGLKFGWELLDIMISPGLQRSQVMIILARTGVGKTLVVLNFMHRMRMVPGQEHLKMLLISLEQTRGEWWDRARRIHRFYDLDSSEEDAARFWDDNLFIVDRNRLSEIEFRQILDDFAYQVGSMPDLLVLDYLGYYARGFKGEPYARTSDAIMSVKGVCKEHRIPSIVPQQVSRAGVDGQEFSADLGRDSVTGDTLITLADGARKPIAELVGSKPQVVVLGEDLRFATRQADRVWRKGTRAVFQVRTRLGRELRCTASHPLFTLEGWKQLGDLAVGDAVAVPADLPVVASHVAWDPIVSIEPVGEEPVYDMSVIGIHNFVANGIVVANSGVIEETADFLLTMWTPDNLMGREIEEQTGAVHLRIGKSRHGGRGQLLSMQRAPLSLVMVPDGDPLAARARQEFGWKMQYHDDWEKAVYRHITGFDGYLDVVDGRFREARRPRDNGGWS